MMKNAFYLVLKALFVFWGFYIFVLTFWLCRKTGEVMVNFKICDVTDWKTNNCNKHCSISQEVKATRQ